MSVCIFEKKTSFDYTLHLVLHNRSIEHVGDKINKEGKFVGGINIKQVFSGCL